MNIKMYTDEDFRSNCCYAQALEEMEICSKCKEPCEILDLNKFIEDL